MTCHRCRAGSALIGIAVLVAGGATAAAPVELAVEDDRVAVRATAAPLRAVLEAIGRECDIAIRSHAELQQPVTVSLGPAPATEVLHRLLRDHSYMLLAGLGADDDRLLWILAPGGTAAAAGWSSDVSAIDASAIDALVVALADPDPAVREEAVLSLGDIGGESVLPFVTQSLSDSSDDVRLAAEAVLDDLGASDIE